MLEDLNHQQPPENSRHQNRLNKSSELISCLSENTARLCYVVQNANAV
jgi:hypothetical protein